MKTSISAAFKHCQRLAQNHYENFPVASRFIAAEKRKYVWAIYAFARTADDFADEIADKKKSLAHLAQWDEELDTALKTDPKNPIFIAIKKTIEDCGIPPSLLHDLVTAFRRDVTQNRHQSFEELLDYCRYSANPIGRLVLILHGYKDDKLFYFSDAICSALQLTNFWQDVSVDMKKDRIYIPQNLMKKYFYGEKELFAKIYNDNFLNLMRELVSKTEALFYQGRPLLNQLHRDLQAEIYITWKGGMTILRKIRELQYNVLTTRPKLKFVDKVKLFGQLFVRRYLFKGTLKNVPV